MKHVLSGAGADAAPGVWRRWIRSVLAAASVAAASGCGAGSTRTTPTTAPARAAAPGTVTDAMEVYSRAGFLTGRGEVPFVGSVRYFAGPGPDSTLAVVSLSLANGALSFTREGDRFRAGYDVSLEAQRDGIVVRRDASHEEVRVASSKETTRSEESVIYQHFFTITPGPASLAVSVRDAGSTRGGTARLQLEVPRIALDGGVAAAPVYEARPRATRRQLPDLAINPRATVMFGRDSTVELYLEGYSLSEPLALRVRVDEGDGKTIYADTIPLVDRGALATGLARLPVARIGMGVHTVIVSGVQGSAAGTVRLPVVVGLGDGLVVPSLDEVVEYLRWFAPATRLRALRDATPDERPAAWLAFVRATDASPDTPENESLREYLQRVQTANVRFREESAAGWATDRGMVFATLGEPDQVVEPAPGDRPDRARTLVWEYTRLRARFTFIDATGFGRWRLTQGSQIDFRALADRRLADIRGS